MNPLFRSPIKVHNTIKNSARLAQIIQVFAKYGFWPWIKKSRLHKLISFELSERELYLDPHSKNLAERLKLAFEELGPTFIKLGQILAARADLIPEDFIKAFERLQDSAQIIDFSEINNILKHELTKEILDLIEWVDPTPLGAASIAQVHKARLKDGQTLVLKIQKPNVLKRIREDIQILKSLALALDTYVEELKVFQIPLLIEEFSEAIENETNFLLEANNIRKFSESFDISTLNTNGVNDSGFSSNEFIKIPKVFWLLTHSKILALELFEGFPLSQSSGSDLLSSEEKNNFSRLLLNHYLQQVFINGFFHGDLHPGNIILLSKTQLGIIDFGIMGRLSHKTRLHIIKMLWALSHEDYDLLSLEYIHLCPFNEKLNADRFAQSLSKLISPYYGLNLKAINTGELLLKTAKIAAHEGLQIPRELLIFFKSLIGIESLIRKLDPEFDFLAASIQFASSDETQKVTQEEIQKSISLVWKDSEHLIKDLPKMIHFFARKWNSPDHEIKLGGSLSKNIGNIGHQISDALFWGLVTLGLMIGLSLFLIFGRNGQAGEHSLIIIVMSSFLSLIILKFTFFSRF